MNKDNISIAIIGPQGVGKTVLMESILYKLKLIPQKGNTPQKNTVSDYLDEEKLKESSFKTSLISFDYQNIKFNFLDTPGNFEMANEVLEAIRAVDLCILMVRSLKGVENGVERLWKILRFHKIPTIIFVNKIDKEGFKLDKLLSSLNNLSNDIVPITIPFMEGSIKSYNNLLLNKEYLLTNYQVSEQKLSNDIAKYNEKLNETIAESSEELLDKFISGTKLTEKELLTALIKAISNARLYPVIFGSAKFELGIDTLFNLIFEYKKVIPPRIVVFEDEERTKIKNINDNVARVYCFKTEVDQYLGTINYLKVVSGEITPNIELTSISGGLKKFSNLNRAFGKKLNPQEVASQGDIVVTTKLDLKTNHTYSLDKIPFYIRKIKYFTPVIYRVITPLDKKDEAKISEALNKLKLEDPAIKIINSEENKELLIGSLGLTHLDFIISRLNSLFNVKVKISEPAIAYRETFTTKAEAEGKHKKQSGGAGQYGHVFIRFEPSPDGFQFKEEIFGGSVPKNYFPAVEKGLEEAFKVGPLAGYPLINVKATLFDGSYHPVDSNEISFKMAAQLAYKEAAKIAKPVILEPIMRLKVTVKDQYVGDIMGDINKRRGKVIGLEPADLGEQIINTEVPEAEIINYAIDLKQMTQGEAIFKRNFLRYEIVPENIKEQIISKKSKN